MTNSILRPNQATRQPKQSGKNCFHSSTIRGLCGKCGVHADVLHVPLKICGAYCGAACPLRSIKPAEAQQ